MSWRDYVAVVVATIGIAALSYAIIGMLSMLYNYNYRLFTYVVLLLGGLSLVDIAGKLAGWRRSARG